MTHDGNEANARAVNVDAYFERIGHSGAREATLRNLREIIRQHTQAIAFENLSPLTGQRVDLAPAALQRKLIHEGRGGYCFEQNLLLRNVLQQLGYRVAGLAARVLWNGADAMVQPRTHMLLHVGIEGEPHVVDVGFGGLTLTGVLRLDADVEQSTPHEPFRFLGSDGTFIMQAHVRSQWRSLYEFDLQEQNDADYEPLNWYTSTYPSSRFISNLVAARTAPDRRYALLNKELAIHHLNGTTERRTLADPEELRESLEKDFLLRLPRTPELDNALARVTGAVRGSNP